MISKSHRFHGHASLKRTYAEGRQVRGSLLALKYLSNERRSSYRAAVVVSRKVDKSAVARNRIRRRIYEVIRGHQHQFIKPYDLIFTVYSPDIAKLSSTKIKKLITDLLVQAGAIKPEQLEHDIVDGKES